MISVTNSDKGSFTMKFSTRDRYALRLMVELANRPNDLIPLKDISDKQRISLKYLEQIVTPLAKAGLVNKNEIFRPFRPHNLVLLTTNQKVNPKSTLQHKSKLHHHNIINQQIKLQKTISHIYNKVLYAP